MDMMTPAQKLLNPSDPIDALIMRQEPGRALDQAFYADPAIFKRDMERLYRRHWLVAGHVGEIPNPGDFFQTHIVNDAIIITRAMDGSIHALVNSCRHRGAHVCTKESGNSRAFTCPYHGWAYGLDGKCLAAREMPAEFDKSAHGLHELPCKVIQGLIFFSLAKHPLSLKNLEASVNESFGPYDWAGAKVAHRESYTIQANWKLAVENYVECYHCAPAHPEYAALHSIEQPLDKIEILTQKMYAEAAKCGVVSKTESDWNTSDSGEEAVYRLRYPLYEGVETGSRDGKLMAPLMGQLKDYQVGATSSHVGGMNFLLAYPDHGVIYRFMPVSQQVSSMEVIWLVRGDAVEGRDYKKEDVSWLWVVTSDADKKITEWNQAGVNSTYYKPGPLSPMEYNEKRWLNWYLAELAYDGA